MNKPETTASPEQLDLKTRLIKAIRMGAICGIPPTVILYSIGLDAFAIGSGVGGFIGGFTSDFLLRPKFEAAWRNSLPKD